MIVLALCLVAAASAQLRGQDVVIIKETPSDNIGVGGYSFGYDLSDGQSRQETAELKNAGSENAFIVMRGSYSYIDPVTGQLYTVNYVADENGFRAEGDHIPK